MVIEHIIVSMLLNRDGDPTRERLLRNVFVTINNTRIMTVKKLILNHVDNLIRFSLNDFGVPNKFTET